MSFTSKVTEWATLTNLNVENAIKASLLDLSSAIILATPVGDPDLWVWFHPQKKQYVDYIAYKGYPKGYIGGTARGAWVPSWDTPSDSMGKRDKKGERTIAKVSKLLNGDIRDYFILTNNIPYIRRLEYGWSSQNPEGMVRVNLRNFNRYIKEAIQQARAKK